MRHRVTAQVVTQQRDQLVGRVDQIEHPIQTGVAQRDLYGVVRDTSDVQAHTGVRGALMQPGQGLGTAVAQDPHLVQVEHHVGRPLQLLDDPLGPSNATLPRCTAPWTRTITTRRSDDVVASPDPHLDPGPTAAPENPRNRSPSDRRPPGPMTAGSPPHCERGDPKQRPREKSGGAGGGTDRHPAPPPARRGTERERQMIPVSAGRWNSP
jgi:hypothetical protein